MAKPGLGARNRSNATRHAPLLLLRGDEGGVFTREVGGKEEKETFVAHPWPLPLKRQRDGDFACQRKDNVASVVHALLGIGPE